MRVVIVDMQPITPAVGGGRLRLLGLYHALGEGIEAVYVGSYDWPGESLRDQQVTPGLREICVPLSAAHHAAAADLSEAVGGKTVIDAAFSWQARLSPAWVSRARAEIRYADVVVFSHPWAYEPLKDALLPGQTVIYDSQNVESLLKADLLGRTGEAGNIIRRLVRNEYALCRRADLVLCCSHADMESFASLFDLPWRKLRLVPNGAFTDAIPQDKDSARVEARRALGLPVSSRIAVFVGSDYGPNVEAAGFIAHSLAPQLPDITFLVVGGAGSVIAPALAPANVVCTGVVDEGRRDLLLRGADLAVNPMSAGSGTNVKMFDFLAAGLPVVSTETGARGICDAASAPSFIKIRPLDRFSDTVRELLSGQDLDADEQPRQYVARLFSWERISRELGKHMVRMHQARGNGRLRGIVFSSWNVACGIAEHASYLVDALGANGCDVLIMANQLSGHAALGMERDLHHPVARTWRWDNQAWQHSGIDLDAMKSALEGGAHDFALIQHHTAFMPQVEFERLLDFLRSRGIPAAIEFHDARHLPEVELAGLASRAQLLLFHDQGEMRSLPEAFRDKAVLMPLPVRSLDKAHRIAAGTGITIGGFGFLRPYKGVLKAIRTLALLRKEFPDATYRGWHALYGEESREYLKDCMAEAARLGVASAVHIDTSFHPIENAIERLSECDIILLPYAPADEGASAAANVALASGGVTVVSPSRIFDSLKGVVHHVDADEPEHYAQAIARLLEDPVRMENLRARGREWMEMHSYQAAAKRIVGLIAAEANPSLHRADEGAGDGA